MNIVPGPGAGSIEATGLTILGGEILKRSSPVKEKRIKSLLRIFLQHRAKRLDPSGQAKAIEARRNFSPSFTNRSQNLRRQSARSCVKFLHGVAFLSWNQHPELTGSRRATPLLLFQHWSGQFRYPLVVAVTRTKFASRPR